MRTGKLSENVLKRSVFRQQHIKREDVLFANGVGVDCAALLPDPEEAVVLSSDPVIWEGGGDYREGKTGE